MPTSDHLCRPRLMDMAEHPDGLDLSSKAALLVICSTQVRSGRQVPVTLTTQVPKRLHHNLIVALGRRRAAERGARVLRLAGQPGRAAPAAHALLRVRARGHVRAQVPVSLRSGLAAWPWPDACSPAGQVIRALLRVRQGAGRAPAGAGRAALCGARGREPRGPAGRGRVAGRGVRGPERPAAGAGRGCAQQKLAYSQAAAHYGLYRPEMVRRLECRLVPIAAAPAPAPKAKQKRWGKARPYYARVVALESLCRAQPLRGAEAKDTVRAELDLGDSGLAYAPGDALGIYPLNCPQAAPCPRLPV